MGRVVAISSGDLQTTHKINEYIVKLAGTENVNLLFIGTASNDNEGYIFNIHNEFQKLGCFVNELSLTSRQYSDEEIDKLLNQADIIYVGGGDTVEMMDIWKKYKLADKLKEIYYADRAILSGISAGAMCWFSCGHSDSMKFSIAGKSGYGWANDLLDLYHYAFCPHYNERMESFDKMIGEKSVPGIALEDNVAYVDKNGNISYISTVSNSKAYKISYQDGKIEKEQQQIIVM